MNGEGLTVEKLLEQLPDESIDRLLFGRGELHRDIAKDYDEAMNRFPFLKRMHVEMTKQATTGNIPNASRIAGLMNAFLFMYAAWKVEKNDKLFWEQFESVDDKNKLEDAVQDGTINSILDFQALLDNDVKK